MVADYISVTARLLCPYSAIAFPSISRCVFCSSGKRGRSYAYLSLLMWVSERISLAGKDISLWTTHKLRPSTWTRSFRCFEVRDI